jgi:hypothetical protein
MSTDDHGQTHPNGHREDADIATGSHVHPHEALILTATNTDPSELVPPHPEDHASDDGVTSSTSVSPVVQLIPQAVLPHAESKRELYHEDAASTTASLPHSDDEGTDEEEDDDEDEDDEDSGEEDDEEDEDEEPALKYERFGGGGYQDLFKKDSASALAVSNKYLARNMLLSGLSPLTLLYRRSVHTMGLHIS